MNRIKMIAADIDGTLLNSEGVVSPATRDALIRAQKQGIRMVIATGRADTYTKREQKQLEMERFSGNYIISLNGQEVYRFSDRKSWCGPRISSGDVPAILKLAYDYCLEALCYDRNIRYQYLPPDYEARKESWIKEHGSQTSKDFELLLGEKISITSWDAPFPKDISKAAFLHTPLRLRQVLSFVRDQLEPKFQAVLTKPNWLEIFPAGISKGKALRHIMEETGIAKDQILVFGDGENDIDMFREVTYSFAMGNGLPCVREAAYSVTGTNDEDGIAQALEHFGL